MTAIPLTPHAQKKQRVDACVSAHGALCAFMLGAQLVIDGTGRAPAQAGNAVYLAALPALGGAALLHALLTQLRKRHDLRALPAVYRAVWGRAGAAACVLTCLVFLADALCALCALSALSSARLLPVHHADASLLPAVLSLFAIAALTAEGLERLAFLSRRFVPALVLLLSALLLHRESVSNLFPLLGFSLSDTACSALFSLGASACALASGFSPARFENAPPIRIKTLCIGGVCACVLLLIISLSAPQSAMLANDAWPALLIHTGAYASGGGLFYLAVVVLECFALLIALCGALHFAIRALDGVCDKKRARLIVGLLALCAAAAVFMGGSALIRYIAPLRFLPALALPALTLLIDVLREKRRKSA